MNVETTNSVENKIEKLVGLKLVAKVVPVLALVGIVAAFNSCSIMIDTDELRLNSELDSGVNIIPVDAGAN